MLDRPNIFFKMDISFKGKRALVTGGSRGIGKGIAIALAKGGADTVAIGTSQTNLDAVTAECDSITTKVIDLSNWDDTRKAIENLGHFDLLVNNAAVIINDLFMDIKPDDFDRQMNVNVKAIINVSQVVAKGMLESKTGGSIVNVSSAASIIGLKTFSVYAGTKGALDSMTRVMANELGHKIRVNCVNPTAVMTDMGKLNFSNPDASAPIINRTPVGRFAEVEDVVNSVLFLLSDKAAMLNGVILPVDGGLTTN